MGISRTPVREAIHKLEREGLLRKLPRGGFTVVSLSREEIEETIGIRCVLESYAARLAAMNHKEEELAPLERKIKEFQKCLDEGRMDALPRINTEFHNLLYGLCRSPKLIKMISDLRDQIYRARKIILNVERMAKVSNQDHRRMLSAIRHRDIEKVESLVREHILRGKEIVRQEMEKRVGVKKGSLSRSQKCPVRGARRPEECPSSAVAPRELLGSMSQANAKAVHEGVSSL